MEVYIQGLPRNISKKTLEAALQPFMNALGIDAWSCKDPFKKDFAYISFLHIHHAKAFLERHGAARPHAPRLSITGSGVYACKSKKELDKLAIQALAHRQDQRAANAEPAPADSAVLYLREISCGHLMFLSTFEDTPTFMRQCSQGCDLRATAKFAKRTLILKYQEVYRVDIPYTAIWDIVVDTAAPVATFILTEVPRFFQLPLGANDGLPRAQGYQGQKKERIGCMGGAPEHKKYVADCLVYQLTFLTSHEHFRQTIEKAIKKNFLPHNQSRIPTESAVGDTDFPTSLRVLHDRMNALFSASRLPFSVLFQVNALVRNNYIGPHVAVTMLDVLEIEFMHAKKVGLPPPFSVQAFRAVQNYIPYPVPGMDAARLTAPDIMSKLEESEKVQRACSPFLRQLDQERSTRQSWILKAMVTPTRITFHGPDLETNNRILRKFSDFAEYFLRVQFCEEDGEDLFFNSGVSHDAILERFTTVFNNGIQIAGRVYGFLGFSHSSLRSHSAWFSAPFVDLERNLQSNITIIRDLGDFKRIQIPARCAARIGQAFSETPFSINLDEHGIDQKYIADVESADGERMFSDGVGTISYEAVRTLWKELPKSSNKATCYQIRWAGAKGMLSLDTRLPGKLFCIREKSMVKFPGGDESQLEICDMASRPLRMVLNRPMIKIMEDLGVGEEWFLRQQKRELDNLKAVTKSIESTSAFLRTQDVGTAIDLPKFIKRLDRRKIDYRTDHFLRSLVEAVVLRELRLLKHKARIPVRKGVTLFGVMDETGFLNEGEVYVTYDKSYRGFRGVVDGTLRDGRVMVTRSPALHPGDIQFPIQRTPPANHPLLALKNCIVFSQRGERDLPSMLSGGDLDGDTYNVIWDPEVEPKTISEAADYSRVVVKGLGREVTKEDMATFFVDFMRTDQLGSIANRHLILADKKEEGTRDGDCMKLAEMHSQAVDFSKTGIPVDVSEMPNHKPKFRPDFFTPGPVARIHDLNEIGFLDHNDTKEDEEEAAPEYMYYKSEKILGKLYRSVDEKDIWSTVHRTVPKDTPSIWDQLLGVVDEELARLRLAGLVMWEDKVENARNIQKSYEANIWDIRGQCGSSMNAPLTELEVLTGSIFNKAGRQSRRQKENSVKMKEKATEVFAWLVSILRTGADPTLDTHDEDEDDASSVATDSTDLTANMGRLVVGSKKFMRMVGAVGLCLACMRVAGEKEGWGAWGSRRWGEDEEIRSFRVVAGSCLLRELDRYAFHLEERRRRERALLGVGSRGGGVLKVLDGVGSRSLIWEKVWTRVEIRWRNGE
ncbi:related to RNA-directed RNA polymerase (RdRP) [Cephalotrichum gorgonifer]|uniref:RNA-dependent RNA polymerase n=1 Tax=Cephalotrichum gorgonifer TaxID=2041049 RepID=A0AAE8SWF0_9PEZI|nr:related to RNA-directed RNA polymerase (RdRP) [Cephalotrichum gorgonifer]